MSRNACKYVCSAKQQKDAVLVLVLEIIFDVPFGFPINNIISLSLSLQYLLNRVGVSIPQTEIRMV